jgi:hypothetical protein
MMSMMVQSEFRFFMLLKSCGAFIFSALVIKVSKFDTFMTRAVSIAIFPRGASDIFRLGQKLAYVDCVCLVRLVPASNHACDATGQVSDHECMALGSCSQAWLRVVVATCSWRLYGGESIRRGGVKEGEEQHLEEACAQLSVAHVVILSESTGWGDEHSFVPARSSQRSRTTRALDRACHFAQFVNTAVETAIVAARDVSNTLLEHVKGCAARDVELNLLRDAVRTLLDSAAKPDRFKSLLASGISPPPVLSSAMRAYKFFSEASKVAAVMAFELSRSSRQKPANAMHVWVSAGGESRFTH